MLQQEDTAKELQLYLHKQSGLHGIRWRASTLRAVTTVINNYQVTVVDLETRAKREVGLLHTVRTASNQFKSLKISKAFEGYRNPFVGKIVDIMPNKDGNLQYDEFVIEYGSGRSKTQEVVAKAELVALFDNSATEAALLEGNKNYELSCKLTRYRFFAFSCFMIDVQQVLKDVSSISSVHACIVSVACGCCR
jgi:hypothetical protein